MPAKAEMVIGQVNQAKGPCPVPCSQCSGPIDKGAYAFIKWSAGMLMLCNSCIMRIIVAQVNKMVLVDDSTGLVMPDDKAPLFEVPPPDDEPDMEDGWKESGHVAFVNQGGIQWYCAWRSPGCTASNMCRGDEACQS